MDLGNFEKELYNRGTGAGIFFLIFGIAMLFMNVLDLDSLGVLISIVICVIFSGLGLFELYFKNDGLYKYEDGLEIVHYRKKTKIKYSEIEYFSVKERWKISAATSSFMLFSKEPHIYFSKKNNEKHVLFFPSYSTLYDELAQNIHFKNYIE